MPANPFAAIDAANKEIDEYQRVGLQHCRVCGDWILTGLDHRDIGVIVEADPRPLTPQTEFDALAQRRPTYQCTLYRGALHITVRTPALLRSHPAGANPHTEIHAQHRCFARMPDSPSKLNPLPPY